MKIEITKEQVEYIKSLDSDKDRKEFLLTAIIENVTSLGESAKFDGRLAYEDKQVELLKITDFPSKINPIPKEMDWTTTTAPRTFEGILNRQEYGTEDFNFGKAYVEAMDRIIPQDELLKFEKLDEINEEFEKNIKTNLFAREFSLSQILNNRGLIGATIEETINEMKKLDESANSKKKYTKEDMRNCFNESRLTHPMMGFKHETFEYYFKTIDGK